MLCGAGRPGTKDRVDALSFFVSEFKEDNGIMDNSVIVSLRDIVVEFDGQRILDGLNLDIHDKEFVTLLGSSGCGKTTTLRLIAGFLEPNAGQVLLKGEDITGVPPYKRPVNTVFQKYALFPHLNVFENVAFGLRLKKMDEETIRRKVRDMLEVVGLKGFERRSISQMSGGQQQRVAIARTLAPEPTVLFMDEPLSNLDAKLRLEMRSELQRLHIDTGSTFIYVTHDQMEAMTLATRICLMENGVLGVESLAENRGDFYGSYGSLFFLGILLSVGFSLAAVLIIYYKQISEGYEDQARFDIMQKVGMTRRDIRSSINSQLLLVFFLPLLLAGLHLAFAFPFVHKLLLLFNLWNTRLLVGTTAASFLAFAVLYTLVYRITSNAYYHIVSGGGER